MKKSLIALAVAAACYGTAIRASTQDVAFTYRMGAGFPGDVNRTNPFSVVPRKMDATTPVRSYGHAVFYDSTNNTARGAIAADNTLVRLQGVLVRPYPTQQTSGGMSASFGAATPPGANNAVDVIEDGHVFVKVDNIAAGAPSLGGAVYVWCAASAGNDVQGGFRCAASAGNAAVIANAQWVGPADANGVAELRIWKQG